MEMVQQSEYDLTNVEVDFKGLDKNSGYHVHIVSIIGVMIEWERFIHFATNYRRPQSKET